MIEINNRMEARIRCYNLDLGFIGAQSAAGANRKNVTNTNRLNKKMFDLSRGSAGNAILPTYLKNADGTPFESQDFGKKLMGVYDASTAMSPTDEMAKYGGAVDKFKGASDAANAKVGEIFNGGVTQTLTNNAAPTQAARLEVPAMTKQAAVESLNETLNSINAHQAARGFNGDGLAKARLAYDATLDANTTASGALAAAHLANAEETQGIRNYGDVQLPLSSLQLPYTMTRQAVDTSNLPQNALLDQTARRNELLNILNIHTTAPFHYQGMPTVQPNVGSGWQAISGLGNMALEKYLQKRATDRINGSGGATYDGMSSYGSSAPAGTRFDSNYSYAPNTPQNYYGNVPQTVPDGGYGGSGVGDAPAISPAADYGGGGY